MRSLCQPNIFMNRFRKNIRIVSSRWSRTARYFSLHPKQLARWTREWIFETNRQIEKERNFIVTFANRIRKDQMFYCNFFYWTHFKMARFLKITKYGNRVKSCTYLYRLTNRRSRHFFRISNKGCNFLSRNVRVRIYKFSRPFPNLPMDIKKYLSLVSSLVVRSTLGFWRIEFWKFEFWNYRLKYSRKYWPNYFSCHRFA